jgi:PIN domain nuclease of toxin-antitoxin system
VTAPILVDTHILLWLRTVPDRLTDQERQAIDNAATRYISAVSLWEISILMSLDRVEQDARFFDVPAGFALLPVTPADCRTLLELPPLHRDPFDRMLIAQARTNSFLLISRDRKIAAYGI